jgi:hypothetical protein
MTETNHRESHRDSDRRQKDVSKETGSEKVKYIFISVRQSWTKPG